MFMNLGSRQKYNARMCHASVWVSVNGAYKMNVLFRPYTSDKTPRFLQCVALLHVRSVSIVHEQNVTIVNLFCSIGEMALDVPMLVITMSIDFIIEHLFLIFAN